MLASKNESSLAPHPQMSRMELHVLWYEALNKEVGVVITLMQPARQLSMPRCIRSLKSLGQQLLLLHASVLIQLQLAAKLTSWHSHGDPYHMLGAHACIVCISHLVEAIRSSSVAEDGHLPSTVRLQQLAGVVQLPCILAVSSQVPTERCTQISFNSSKHPSYNRPTKSPANQIASTTACCKMTNK